MTPPPRQWLRRTKTPRAVRRRADPPTANQRVAAPGVVLLTLLVAVFMGPFDFFVVNVAAPPLRHDLHSSDAGLELIVGGYAFSYAGALVLGGRLGDIFGHRRLFIVGMVGFAITSAVCGLSTASGQLVGGRLGQGLTAALMLPQVLALISASPDACRRSQAMAWYGVAGGVGAIAGQVLGGLLITANIARLGWRTIFWVNVPVGALGALAAVRVLPSAGRTARSSFNSLDPLGALGFAAGLALMLIPLTVGRSTGWPWWTWVSIAAAMPVLGATARWERALQRRGAQPVFDPTLLRVRSFRAGLLANAAFMAFSASALTAPQMITRWGRSVLIGGSVLTAAGLVTLAALAHSGQDSLASVVIVTTAISLGNGIILPTLIGAALVDIAPQHAGSAAGAFTTAQQFASALGVAGIGTRYFAAAAATGSPSGAEAGMTWAAGAGAVLALSVGALELAKRHAVPASQERAAWLDSGVGT